jgi:hypothetical protein
MESLVVTVELGSPLALPWARRAYPLTLDAVVVALAAIRDGRRLPPIPYDPERDPYAPGRAGGRIPLAVAGEKRPVYRASAAALPRGVAAWGRAGWAKRCDKDLLRCWCGGKPPDDARGPYRAWRGSFDAVAAPAVRFWCVGDRAGLEELLAFLPALGPRRAVGFGEVIHASVEPAADWSLVGPDGQPARPLPVEDWPDGAERGWRMEWCACRPPYWAAANMAWCWMPPTERWLPLCEPKFSKGLQAERGSSGGGARAGG